jgi:hypothetical protein
MVMNVLGAVSFLNKDDVTNNEVIINNGYIINNANYQFYPANVIGGFAQRPLDSSGSGSTIGNIVIVNGGSIKGIVYGGSSMGFDVNNKSMGNTVIVNNSSFAHKNSV